VLPDDKYVFLTHLMMQQASNTLLGACVKLVCTDSVYKLKSYLFVKDIFFFSSFGGYKKIKL